MELVSALPKSLEAEVRALRVDVSKGRSDPAHVRCVISDRFHFLERAKKNPDNKDEDEAYITQGPSGR